MADSSVAPLNKAGASTERPDDSEEELSFDDKLAAAKDGVVQVEKELVEASQLQETLVLPEACFLK